MNITAHMNPQEKAPLPILVTLSGTLMLIKLVQL
jgi:hypothetical protein